MSILKLKNVNKSFFVDEENDETVLDNLNLEIERGSFVVIYGPSGCGKSTLLNIISGLDRDYEGEVYYEEQVLKFLDNAEITTFRKNYIGFIFQNFNLIPHMNVLENILIPMYLNGETKVKNIATAKELLTSVDLEQHTLKNVTKLSGGQKQRVAIARSLANNPEIIIADEPTGSLDSVSQARILDILKELTHEKKTVIVVTHNQEVAEYADHIIEMKDGKIVRDDREFQLTDTPTSPKPKKNAFKMLSAFKIALSNFKQRKWRNIMISAATSIGIAGVLISLGLGNGIVSLIEKDMSGGKIPSQIQVSLNKDYSATALNENDESYIKTKIDNNEIKYMESPFSVSLMEVDIPEHGKLNLADTMPSYSQIVSLYENPKIKVVSNAKEDILAGTVYTNPKEKGLTVTESFVKDFNQANKTNLKPKDFINLKINGKLLESSSDGEKMGSFNTVITRVLKDELDENNSFMSSLELNSIVKENNFTKNTPFILVELMHPEKNKEFVEKINSNKKYAAFSQTDIVDVVVNFIKIIQGLLIFMSLQAIIVSIVMISVILYINIVERTKEIGIMKALGYQNREINLIFATEAFCITSLSLIISLIGSTIIGYTANMVVLNNFKNISQVFSISFSSIVYTIILSLLMALISSSVPMMKVGKLDPANSLRYE